MLIMQYHRLLYSIFFQYKNSTATKKDILQALDQYRALTFRQDSYVFNDGARKELVNLSGTIPVIYKSMYAFIILKMMMIMMTHK